MKVYDRYKVILKKTKFLVGRVLIKSVLSKYLEMAPENIQFIKNKYGELYLKDNTIQFNISHSKNMLTCAITLNNEIGVEVEKVNGPIDEIVKRFFSVGEREYIAKFRAPERKKYLIRFGQ